MLPELYEQGVTAVMANRGGGGTPYPHVTGDDFSGISTAVDYLKKLGHKNIVHIAGPDNYSTSHNRREAFIRACENGKIDYRVVHATALTAAEGEKAMDDLLATRQSFTAVQASNDLLALGALRSIRRHGLSCPDDISVVGFNDMPFAEEFSPGLTTIKVPLEEIGTESARLLVDAIQNEKKDQILVTLPVSLVTRGSTGPAKKPSRR
jgi:LacI family transcriptional regulator